MKTFKEWSGEEDLLFEMSNCRTKTTGLPMVVYVSTKYVGGKEIQHGPRIKVAKTYDQKFNSFDSISITISDEPEVIGEHQLSRKDIELVKKFIIINKEVLLAYWDGDIETIDMLNDLIANKSKLME